jgi:hypothetical protein
MLKETNLEGSLPRGQPENFMERNFTRTQIRLNKKLAAKFSGWIN